MVEPREDPRAATIDAIREVDASWSEPAGRLQLFGNVPWKPDLRHAEGHLLHIAFGAVAEPWAKRLRAANAASHPLALAFAPRALTLDNLILAQELDAKIFTIDEAEAGGIMVVAYSSVAELLAEEEFSLGEGGLERIAMPLLDRAVAESDSYRKGLMFEQVLCLLFSQVGYVTVVEHRYRNETEEVDLVLANRATGHLSGIFAGPLILVSGKNQTKATGAPDVRALRGNMSKRRKRCNFGVVCAAGRIADEAEIEQGEATDDPEKAIALLDGHAIRGLLASSSLDNDLEAELMKAVLRPRRGRDSDA